MPATFRQSAPVSRARSASGASRAAAPSDPNAEIRPSAPAAAAERRQPSRIDAARRLLGELTDREHEVVLAVARGLSNRQIGRELSMTETTVKAHVSRALAKLRLSNRVQAAVLVHEAALL
ncbi:response regulator transcription factor [Nonomuraea sp. NPDC001831]|uniref:response regulator transcription factor n=1 Tax=Nonomuraea sp. NPDC001831 TaxID=3364340 RepID=UPI00367BCFE8